MKKTKLSENLSLFMTFHLLKGIDWTVAVEIAEVFCAKHKKNPSMATKSSWKNHTNWLKKPEGLRKGFDLTCKDVGQRRQVVHRKSGRPLGQEELRKLIEEVHVRRPLGQEEFRKLIEELDVLQDLNLEPETSNTTLVEAAKVSSGGESEEHKQLKKYVRAHPERLRLRHKSKDAAAGERSLPSGDSLDVSFESPQRWTAVEVKSAKSDTADHTRGVFQCVKYEAVMEAELVSKGKRKRDFEVKAILVVEGNLRPELWGLANTLGVDVREVRVGIYRT